MHLQHFSLRLLGYKISKAPQMRLQYYLTVDISWSDNAILHRGNIKAGGHDGSGH
ncbi:MAG: hypothetical protein GY878_21565 [Fuerstiella sp.]|nr:hypothetical protein [Fuerstiella sp.]